LARENGVVGTVPAFGWREWSCRHCTGIWLERVEM